MDHELFVAVGEALFGSRWKMEMAVYLQVDYRTLQRWAKGEFSIPWGVKAELKKLCQERGGELLVLAARLQEKPTPVATDATGV